MVCFVPNILYAHSYKSKQIRADVLSEQSVHLQEFSTISFFSKSKQERYKIFNFCFTKILCL